MGNCCSFEKSEKKGPIVATPAHNSAEPKHNPFVISDTDLVATRSPSMAAQSLCGSAHHTVGDGDGFAGHTILEEDESDAARGRATGANPRISIADPDGSPRPADAQHHHLGMTERLSGIFHRRSVDGRPHSGLFQQHKKSLDGYPSDDYDSETPAGDMAPVMQSIVVDTGIMPGIGQGLKAQSSYPQR